MSQKGHTERDWKIGRLEWSDKVKNRRYIFSLEIGSCKKKAQKLGFCCMTKNLAFVPNSFALLHILE